MKSIYEEEEKQQIEKEYQEAEAKEKTKNMKYKWIWTPKGLIIALLTISCLGIAGWLDASDKGGIGSTVLLVLGILLLAFGWINTYINVKKRKM